MAFLLKELVFLAILASAVTFPRKPNGKLQNNLLFTIFEIDVHLSVSSFRGLLILMQVLFAFDIFHCSLLLLSLRLNPVDLT